MKQMMLSTFDNPFNPFTNFDEWLSFDLSKGYFTCALLGRVAKTSIDLSDSEEIKAINEAIIQICLEIPEIYIAVEEPPGLKDK